MNQPVPFEITTHAETGMRFAFNGAISIALHDHDGAIFRRRAVAGVGTGSQQNIEWVVVELDGVRVYVDSASGSVVVSRQDIRP